jgi:hypothetical protein
MLFGNKLILHVRTVQSNKNIKSANEATLNVTVNGKNWDLNV